MGRGKLKLERITNEKSRKTTFHKRKRGLLKKAYEFSVLCGVDICLLVSGCGGDDDDSLETWPPERDAALRIIERYRSAAGRNNFQRKSCGLADVVAEKSRKVEDEIARRGKSVSAADSDLLHRLSAADMAEFVLKLDAKIDSVRRAIEAVAGNGREIPFLAPPETNHMLALEHFNTVGFTAGTAAGVTKWAMVGGSIPHYRLPQVPQPQHFFPSPPPLPPFQFQYQTLMNGSLVPRIGIDEISPVIRMACDGNTELASVVNSFMRRA